MGLTRTAPADEVDLTTGQTLRGIIEDDSGETIRITVAGLSRMAVPRSRVVAIRRADAADNALLMGQLHLEQGLLWQAAQHLREALDQGIEAEQIVPALLANPMALATRLESEPPEHADQIRRLFLQVLGEAPRDGDVLHLAGRICEATGENGRARRAYDEIDESWWQAHPQEAQEASQFYLRHAREELEAGNLEDVTEMLEEMTELDNSLSSQLRPVFLVRLANLFVEQGEYAQAVQIVADEVSPLAPETARTWLESVFQEMENRPLTGESLEAIVPVFARQYRQFFPEDADAKLADLHRRLGDQMREEGRWEQARAAYNEYYRLSDPEAALRPLVLACTYEERASELAPDDWDGRVRLTVDMVESELYAEALEQIEILKDSGSSDVRAFALQQRNAIQGRLAEEAYQRAFSLYSEGKSQEALDVLTREASNFENARLIEEINELRRLCESRMREAGSQRAYQALSRYQEAERRFLLGRYQEAIPLYQAVVADYAGTPAARDAATRLEMAARYLAARNPTDAGFGPNPVSPEVTAQATPPERESASAAIRRAELESLLDAVSAVQASETER